MHNPSQEILDKFGELLIKEGFDNQLKFIKNSLSDLQQTDGYKNLFENMSSIQKTEIENYTSELLKGLIFDLLRVFEENENFKIVYEENDNQINLNELSEMLKAELIIPNGWIDKFSDYKDK